MNATQTKVIRAYRAGNSCRWIAALAAARLGHGELNELAEELAVDVRTVRNLRAAGRVYRALRPRGSHVPFLAKTLGYSHFAKLAGPLDDGVDHHSLIEDLRIAYQERVPVAAFGQQMTNLYSQDETPQWHGWLDRLHKNAVKLQDAYGAPDYIKDAAAEFVRMYEQWRELA